MATSHRRTLREIAASGTPALRQKVADFVLVDLLKERRVDCVHILRRAAVSLSLSLPDEAEARSAKEILIEIGTRQYRTGSLQDIGSLHERARKNLLALPMQELAENREVNRLRRMLSDATALACCGDAPGPGPLPLNDRDNVLEASALLTKEMKEELAELRKAGLHGRKLSRPDMYRLICVECFRLGTAKPLIKQGYGATTNLQSNLLKRLSGDTKLIRLFYGCWGKMAASDAILRKKAHEGVSSINPHTQEITDPLVRDAVKWALSEQRRVRNGSSSV